MNVVLIPNYTRPEMLTIMLEQLEKTVHFRSHYYLFTIDYGGLVKELTQVINQFFERNQVAGSTYNIPKTPYTTTKQSFAIVSGYRKAIELENPEYVFLLEDDIIVANNFFHWHYTVHETNDIFCSIGTRNHNKMYPIIKRYEAAYIDSSYQSLGVCWPKTSLTYALSLFTDSYFINPVSYIKNTFPDSKIGLAFVEQDGLFNRIVEYNNAKVVYPYYPVAYHAGFYGKNRGRKPTGTIADKIEIIRNTIFSPHNMRNKIRQQGDPLHYVEDSIPITLEQPLITTTMILHDQYTP